MTRVFLIVSWLASLATEIAVGWYGVDRARTTAPTNVGEVTGIVVAVIAATCVLAISFLFALDSQNGHERDMEMRRR